MCSSYALVNASVLISRTIIFVRNRNRVVVLLPFHCSPYNPLSLPLHGAHWLGSVIIVVGAEDVTATHSPLLVDVVGEGVTATHSLLAEVVDVARK